MKSFLDSGEAPCTSRWKIQVQPKPTDQRAVLAAKANSLFELTGPTGNI